jgi:hypothetical protein
MSNDETATSLAADMLPDVGDIALFIFGVDDKPARRKVYHLVSEVDPKKRLPVFRLGERIKARRSTLRKWIEDQERPRAAK